MRSRDAAPQTFVLSVNNASATGLYAQAIANGTGSYTVRPYPNFKITHIVPQNNYYGAPAVVGVAVPGADGSWTCYFETGAGAAGSFGGLLYVTGVFTRV